MNIECNYLNEKEVSNLTGRALSTLRNDRFARRGIAYTKWGNRFIRYKRADVLRYMEDRRIATRDMA